ncbi:MAG: DUF488 domain-containing protein [Planctomycetia bacterium]|jgi:uncharacterized protein YeaO (DUF488 family)|nr:DUF488 domain-containing protein [Planctomycetia bacterium]
MAEIKIKRVYDAASSHDGLRILVERLWPRGVTKEKAAIDYWLKDVAPSGELRKWFGHDPAKWEQFKVKYWEELRHNSSAVETLREHIKKSNVTFVYAARDEKHNGALALQEFLEQL